MGLVAEFAQIVGLLAAFSSGRRADETAELVEFLEWLTEHNHSDLRKLIEQNQTTSISIKSILNLHFDEIDKKLNNISKQLAELAKRTSGTETLAAGFSESLISDQAFEILSLMEEHKTEYFLISKTNDGAPPTLLLSQGPKYQVKEPRFLEDDLGVLVAFGLLLLEDTKDGKPIYRFTRAASRLFK